MLKIEVLNSSYTKLTFSNTVNTDKIEKIEKLKKLLSIERDGWMFDYQVKRGFKSKYDLFYHVVDDNTLVINSGTLELPHIQKLLDLPESEIIQESEFEEIEDFLEDILSNEILPFEPYDYQVYAASQALSKQKKLSLMCTGSGKSLTISLCLEYFRRKSLRGVLVVPNINLLTQFAKDIKSYNLEELYDSIITFGGGSKAMKSLKDQESQALKAGDLVITTWQSLSKLDLEFFNSLDYVICDEVHRFSSKCTSGLVNSSIHAKYKLGFTGTLPDQKTSKMTLIGLFGVPETIITSAELIEAGRGTPIKVTGITVNHQDSSDHEVTRYFEFLDKLQYTLSIPERTDFIADLALKASKQDNGSTLVLFKFIEHGETLFKAITGEKVTTFDRMRELGVYFMSGASSAKDREKIRNIMDEDSKAILVANYALLSTGVNIKSLRYAIFASPVKSGVTVAQSLGRGIRLSEGKQVFEVYDIVDSFRSCRIFRNQYNARKKVYNKSNFEIQERQEQL